jgi:RNA polymerase sigma-70 factor (ECF subfamily)
MYALALKVLKNPTDAEDAAMDAVRNVIANIKKFVGLPEKDTICLLSIYVRNASFKIYNKNKKTPVFVNEDDVDIVDHQVNVENTVIDKLKFETVAKRFQSLPEIYSHPFILRHYFGYSVKEIMQTLNLSEAAVKKRLVRAKQQILTLMENENEEHHGA